MPAVAVKGAIIVVSVAVAAAIAVYESPQARQFAEDVRRRIALALHSLGDEINPNAAHPRFNRPEDAQGFLQSSAEPGIDADEESQRRQREELMYWNAIRAEKVEKEKKLLERLAIERPPTKPRGPSFDDFLQEDKTSEKGTFVYNTGADVNREAEAETGLRNRGVRGLNVESIYSNPFSDEQQFEAETQRAIDASLISPDASEKYEVMSDLYTASEPPRPSYNLSAPHAEQLLDISEPVPDPPVSYPSMEEPYASTSYANMAERDNSPYASIHAWSDNTTRSFYAPPPAAPGSPLFSDPPESVPGDLTPTDSVSVAGSGEEVWAPRSGATSEGDVMSVDGDGISTPGSWTEVGSVVSENDMRH